MRSSHCILSWYWTQAGAPDLGREGMYVLEKEMATHSSVLAWRIPGTQEPGWAAICGVAQSWTRLMWLSSSSSLTNSTLHGTKSLWCPTGGAWCSVFWNFPENHPLGIGEAPYRRVLIRARCYKSAWGTEVLEKTSSHQVLSAITHCRSRALEKPTLCRDLLGEHTEWGRKTPCLCIASSESFADGAQHAPSYQRKN